MNTLNPLPRSFYERDTVAVARDLLGKVLICSVADVPFIGRIVETEAYRSDDPACHAYRGLTKRNSALFGPVGHSYIYLSYGIHWCMNIVSRPEGVSAGGVLIRGIEQMSDTNKITRRIDGPGRTGKALQVSLEHNGIDLTQSSSLLCVYDDVYQPAQVLSTPRIGISQGVDKLWRFVIPISSLRK